MSLALEWKDSTHHARVGERRRPEAEEVRRRKRAKEERKLRLTFTCFVLVALFISSLLILSICLHVMVVQNEMRVNEIEREIELERRQQEAARLEIASLESPARIEKMAVEQLNMVQMTLAEYLETPAYQAARLNDQNDLTNEEAMVSDTNQGGL
jgi:cell division protein FtsL